MPYNPSYTIDQWDKYVKDVIAVKHLDGSRLPTRLLAYESKLDDPMRHYGLSSTFGLGEFASYTDRIRGDLAVGLPPYPNLVLSLANNGLHYPIFDIDKQNVELLGDKHLVAAKVSFWDDPTEAQHIWLPNDIDDWHLEKSTNHWHLFGSKPMAFNNYVEYASLFDKKYSEAIRIKGYGAARLPYWTKPTPEGEEPKPDNRHGVKGNIQEIEGKSLAEMLEEDGDA